MFAHFDLAKGDVAAGLAAADLVVEGTYRVGHQEQLYIENNAMIAVPRDDGGVTVHGSLQCPYYVHKALKRGLGLDADQARVVQAETGGGFGGKEEYPSMIGLHAALLARRTGRPVRMIYDRHEDLAATTKRHPAIVTHRTGVMRDGRLVAQDIELVLDGGAYTTLTPVVLSRATIHAGGPYDVPNVRIRSRAVMTNTPPNGAFRGFGAPQSEFAAETQLNRVAEAIGMSPLEIRRRNVYRSGRDHADAAGPPEWGRRRGGPRARGGGVRVRAWPGAHGQQPAPRRTARDRTARGIGLALAWHGAGFTGSGEAKMGSVVSLELTADGAVRILTASTEMGQGTKTIFPQLVAAELGLPIDEVEIAPHDTAVVPDSGPTVASRTAMVVGGMLVHAARRLRDEVEARTGRPFADGYRDDARSPRPDPDRPALRAIPRRRASTTPPTPATPTRRSAGRPPSPRSRSTSTRARSRCCRSSPSTTSAGSSTRSCARARSRAGRCRRSATRRSRRSSCSDGRYLNDRLQTYLIPTALDAPRIETILVEAPFDRCAARREGRRRAADGRRRPGGRRRDPRCDRRLDPRPAGDPRADPGGPRRDRPAGAARDLDAVPPADRGDGEGGGR